MTVMPNTSVGKSFGVGNASTLVCLDCYAKLGFPGHDNFTAFNFPKYRAIGNPDAICSPYVGCGNHLTDK